MCAGRPGLHRSPFNRGWWNNLVDFFGWNFGGSRPEVVNWKEKWGVEDEEKRRLVDFVDV